MKTACEGGVVGVIIGERVVFDMSVGPSEGEVVSDNVVVAFDVLCCQTMT